MSWIAFYIVGSGGLVKEQQQANGDQFYTLMSGYGFSDVACAAIWSNILFESGGNPQAWETGNLSNGFGLTQWTPATKIRDWAANNNMNPDDGDVQCLRIYNEFLQPGPGSPFEQYYPTSNFPVSAAQFMSADLSEHDMAWWSEAFTRNYERPNEQRFQERKAAQFAAALEYYERFSGEQPPPGNYRVNLNISGNGYAYLDPSKQYYEPREIITIKATAYTGESILSISSVPDVGMTLNKLSFEMPGQNVVISITFSGSGGGGGGVQSEQLVLRLVENNNIEVWQNGKCIQWLPNEQNTFKLNLEVKA